MECLKIEDLVRAILARNDLEARQWVADARRGGLRLDRVEEPNLGAPEMPLTAGVVELLAERFAQPPPSWTARIGGLERPFYVSASLLRMKRSGEIARQRGPEPLRRRNVFALPDFLSVV